MPLFEYECLECGERFEALVVGAKRPACPECGSEDLQKLLSTFGVGGGASTGAAPCGSPAKGPSCFSGG
jgi:putative FmdB family regulatory protein